MKIIGRPTNTPTNPEMFAPSDEQVAAAVAAYVAENPFEGEPGKDGQNGSDGISPTVTVSKSDKVTTISITDKNGTKTATINDGADGSAGAAGKTPVKGTDYFTAADKTEMVNAVIAALPVYNGEVV